MYGAFSESHHDKPWPNGLIGVIHATLVATVDVGNTLGEGVLWDEEGQRAWWTDIQERLLFRYGLHTGVLEKFELPERLGSFGFVEGSDRVIAAFESGFAFYHPESATLDWVIRPAYKASNIRFNDGRVDRQGRFWAGTMVEGRGFPVAELYCLSRGRLSVHLGGIGISNSVCFSLDSQHLYFADSPLHTIYRFNVDPRSGALSNRELFAQTAEGCFPDGSNIDQEGHLWNARWGGGALARYTPAGRIQDMLKLPVSQPTCLAFGGPSLDTLFVTTAREGLTPSELKAQPLAGHLLIYKVRTRGVREPRYRK